MSKGILIVEEEAQVAEALVRRLRARGYAPTHAVTQAQALEVFDLARPDLLVLSLTLPGDGGRAICREVRARPMGALVPILFLGTGGEDVRSVGEAIAAGADHYFRKPDGLEELIGKVTAYIGPGSEASDPPVAEPVPAEPTGGDELFATMNDALAQPATVDAPGGAVSETVRAAAEVLTRTPTVEPLSQPVGTASGYGWRLDEGYEQPESPAPEQPTPPEQAPGHAYTPPQPPPPDQESDWQAVLQPGRSIPLGRRGVGEILAAASRARMTGRFEVASGGVLRRVFVEEGRPVYADSSSDDEDLSATLASEGLVSRSALERARQRAAQVGGTPEEVLIEAGFLQPEDVYRALRDHVVERVLSLFALEAGETVVVRAGARPLDPVDLAMHAGRLVLDGVRRKYGRLRLYRVFGTASAIPRPRPGVEPEPGLSLRPDEEAVLRACDGRRSVLEVARAAQTTEVDALAILYAFAVLDLVEGPRGRTGGALPPLESEAIARAGSPRTADQMPGFADLVSVKYSEVLTADYHQVLGVSRSATGAEIHAAWTSLRRRFDPHRVRRAGALWHQVSEIAAVVDDAYAMLSDGRLRARYERALS